MDVPACHGTFLAVEIVDDRMLHESCLLYLLRTRHSHPSKQTDAGLLLACTERGIEKPWGFCSSSKHFINSMTRCSSSNPSS